MDTIAGMYVPAGQPLASTNTMVPIQVNNKGEIIVVGDPASPVPVTQSAPVGGGITWGAAGNVTLNGSSQTALAANPARKGIIIGSTATNASAAVDITGGTAALTKGIPLGGGGTIILTGAECPLGTITVIGTNGQILTVYEGV